MSVPSKTSKLDMYKFLRKQGIPDEQIQKLKEEKVCVNMLSYQGISWDAKDQLCWPVEFNGSFTLDLNNKII